jgi:hypothetical protein
MYEQHKAVGEVLRSIEYPNTEVLLDAACGGKGAQIRLYGDELAGRNSSLAYIDAALVVNGEIKVVVEIEYSTVRPLYLCGKVFATALSSYHSREKVRIPLADEMMFVQVIQFLEEQSERQPRKRAKRTSRLPQCVYLEREINRLLQDTRSRIRRYVFHYASSGSFDIGGNDAQALKKEILDFLRPSGTCPREAQS